MRAFELPEIKKVAIVGPECTGKTDLAQFLAKHYKTEWVPEYARGYLNNLRRPYQQHDLLTIAHGQLRLEDEYSRYANRLLICDTELHVIKIWSEVKFGNCPEELLDLLGKRSYHLYLLTFIDVPWEDDPQREHPQRREELYKMYAEEMRNQRVPVVEISGSRDERRKKSIEHIDSLLT